MRLLRFGGSVRPFKQGGLVLAILLAILLAFPTGARAQNSPRIGYAYPAGGRQGSSFEVVIGGQFLDGATNAHFSGAGIQAAVIEHNKPLTQQQFVYLREKLKTLLDRKLAFSQSIHPSNTGQTNSSQSISNQSNGGLTNILPQIGPGGTNTSAPVVWTDADEQMVGEVRKKLAYPPNRMGNPAIAETVRLRVDIASDSEIGERELRLETAMGLSNPRVFRIGQQAEFSQKPARGSAEARSAGSPGMSVTLPCVANGQILPGGVDRYQFHARKGQRLVFAVSARELIPYLPDAVPGWFQAALALRDASGKELAYAGNFLFHPDPVLFYVAPADGEYRLEIRDSLYRGREDFVYRIAMGELPYVTCIFPMGAQAGAQTAVAIKGWNLSAPSVTHHAKDEEPGIHPLSDAKPEWQDILFEAGTLPECLEKEPNNDLRQAQPVTPPIVVNGRIAQPGDRDLFSFMGRAGEVIVAEVLARRLNSPLDSTLKLTDATGKQLAFNDDHEDKAAGLNTHHADSWLSAILPADGAYYLHLTDAQQKGGPDYGYRLRLGAPRLDYELRVVPSTVNARAGATVPITVFALRKDGFTNEIVLALKDAPAGFVLGGGRVPPFQDRVQCTLTAPPEPLKEPLSLRLEGVATIQGRELIRSGVPSEDMMQAFSFRHLVPAKELKAATLGGAAVKTSLKILNDTPVKIPPGGMARVRVSGPQRAFQDKMQLQILEPAEGISIRQISPLAGGMEIVLACDGLKLKSGFQGNLIVGIYARQTGPAAAKGQANNRRAPLNYLPAIPFEIGP
jgi:hypothetical protein